jgi:hypothetical protein
MIAANVTEELAEPPGGVPVTVTFASIRNAGVVLHRLGTPDRDIAAPGIA